MKTLYAPTEEFVKGERTRLSSAGVPGSNVTLLVENTSGFAVDRFAVIGFEGSETCELQRITAITDGTHIEVEALTFNHPVNEPVREYRFDKRKFYGSVDSDGPWVELTDAGSPKGIEVDDPQGTVLEYVGTDYGYFKATYYNSFTGEESDPNEAQARAGDDSAHYTSLYEVRVAAGFLGNAYYLDSRIEDKRREAEAEVRSAIGRVYKLPLSYVPDYVRAITTMLAAGKILFQEYPDSDAGAKLLGEARSMLKKITDGVVLLYDLEEAELERLATNRNSLQGGPTDDSDRSFSRGMRF